jgi:hypothetical protein
LKLIFKIIFQGQFRNVEGDGTKYIFLWSKFSLGGHDICSRDGRGGKE